MADLAVAVDQNRFLDEKGNTKLELLYQVPYNELIFLRDEFGFTAELKVVLSLEKDGKEVYRYPFSNKIVVREFDKTNLKINFKDKISLTLSKSGFVIKLSFEDPNKMESIKWESEFFVLPENIMISDLEFNEKVIQDTTLFMANLHRNGMLFDATANHVLQKENEQFVLYYELQNFGVDQDEKCKLTETLSIIRNEEVVLSSSNSIEKKATTLLRLKNVNITELDPGYYSVILKVDDEINQHSSEVKDYFVLKENETNKLRLFTSIDDEYSLIRYFAASGQSVWKNLSPKGKENFISRFWHSNDPTPGTERNEFFEVVQKRVKIANQRYKSFCDGWDTDMGRIYIRHGQPDEIVKASTGLVTKYAEKDYQIWKYRTSKQLTYIFIDIQNNNKFKMIYSSNDLKESSYTNWKEFLGIDFDENVLE